ncbi:MAG: hypothetical protein K2I63_01490 [Helicobacter sp.]|nr:hypothetical protein [Helicobacter sp.]
MESILKEQNTLQKQLLALRQFSLESQNSGAVFKALCKLLKDLNTQDMQDSEN